MAVANIEELVETEPNYEHFNEDENNDRIEKILKEKKKFTFGKWMGRLFSSSDSFEYKPKSLSDDECIDKAYKTYRTTLDLLGNNAWKDFKENNDGDIVQVLNYEKYGKLFLLTGKVEGDVNFLAKEFHENIESSPEWNKTLLQSRFIKKVNNNVDITYQVIAGGGGGAVKPRDFVNLRYSGMDNGRFVTSGNSIELPDVPPTEYIRGENKIGCWCIQSLENSSSPFQCRFQWLMGVDFKGWLPTYVVDMAIPTAMFEMMTYLRIFCKENSHKWENE